MTNWRRTTRLAIVFGLLALAVGVTVYDLLAIAYGGVDASISRTILGDFTIVPLVPLMLGFGVGIVVGHLAWPQPPPPKGDT